MRRRGKGPRRANKRHTARESTTAFNLLVYAITIAKIVVLKSSLCLLTGFLIFSCGSQPRLPLPTWQYEDLPNEASRILNAAGCGKGQG